ncbi:hypothetical protein [Sphingomonas sp. PAMC 26605]|uniref:hypothetical protein n=1 Tax=Sphingomonas sp. PAMC 26605 TaxID=1112214 RepID=UPI00026CD23E|nr:hypothetical protein [Sphingomonas sp. PAMC 26605]
MIARAIDILYTQIRLDQTLSLAEDATEGCAKASHLGLANLYRAELVRLNAAMPHIAPKPTLLT